MPDVSTHEQRLDAWNRNRGNAAATARELGLGASTVKEWAARNGLKANPLTVTGRSTLRNADGEVVMEWEKTSLDREAAEEARQAIFEAMREDLPRVAPVAPPMAVNAALCNLYTFTDYHMGMLAWHKEGGADWDLGIAERTLVQAFAAMIEQSPSAASCIINLQGDFLHSDGLVPVTPAHHHVLDQDGRYSKIVKSAIRCIKQLVRMALERHASVHLIICEGNHDESGTVWMRGMFESQYEDEPRVTVNDSELPYYVHQHGEVMLCFHHGHKVKNEQLPLLFAAQFPKLWGNTSKRFAHCGHRHHCDEKEYNGMTVIQHPTLAARDAYAARGGWIAERAAQAITYHAKYGQVGRAFVSPEMLEAA